MSNKKLNIEQIEADIMQEINTLCTGYYKDDVQFTDRDAKQKEEMLHSMIAISCQEFAEVMVAIPILETLGISMQQMSRALAILRIISTDIQRGNKHA